MSAHNDGSLRERLYLMLLMVGLMVLAGVGVHTVNQAVFTSSSPAQPVPASPNLKPLTQGPVMDGFGAWSPDGRQIAFMRDGQIMVTDRAGKAIKPLTQEAAFWDADPVWRQDGKEIAFVRISRQNGGAQVMRIPAGGGQAQTAASEGEPIGYVAWSPDGAALFYTTRGRLQRVDLATGQRSVVYQAASDWEMLAGGLAISPDGKEALFGVGPRTEGGVIYDIWSLPLATPQSNPQRLTNRGGIMPAFDRTGRLLAYRSPRQERGIWLLNRATGQGRRIIPDEDRALYFHPNFAPDGTLLVVSRLVLPEPSSGRGFTSNLYLHSLGGSGGEGAWQRSSNGPGS